MKTIIILIGLMITPSLQAKPVNCKKHKLYCKIKKLKPRMSKKQAMSLSNIIYKQSKIHRGDPNLAVAIGMQETGLRNINRTQNIIQFNKDKTTWTVRRGVSDVCMYQFHVNTIVSYKIDPIKLLSDINYCVAWHFKVMRDKKKMCRKYGKEAWGCYHSKTKILRKHYIKLVSRYL